MNTLEGRAWQALAAVKGMGPKALWQAAEYLFHHGQPASWLLRNPARAREALKGIKGDVVFPDPDALALGEAEAAGESKVTILHPLHPGFPGRVTERRRLTALPAVMYALGNLSLLERPCVSVVGRRDADEAALKIGGELASLLAAGGVHVISGYASGIDCAAHLGALRSGGTTTLVLAEGLGWFQVRPDFKGLMSDENTLVLSQFAPQEKWAAFQAMARNKLVAALADALVVVASGPERDAGGRMSGTFNAAMSALRLGLPVFAADPTFFPFFPAGNRELINKGALAWSPSSGAAPIMKAMKDAANKKLPAQRNLFE